MMNKSVFFPFQTSLVPIHRPRKDGSSGQERTKNLNSQCMRQPEPTSMIVSSLQWSLLQIIARLNFFPFFINWTGTNVKQRL